ncbi:MAG: cytochrome c3 family protein [Duodenibacillus sp.]
MKTLSVFFIGLCLSVGVYAAPAQKFLGDRHVERGVACPMCHGQGTPKAQLPEDSQKHEPCVQCHGFYDKVAARTKPKDPDEQNPHGQHDGNLPCTSCHQGHKPGVNYCEKCHMWSFKVP